MKAIISGPGRVKRKNTHRYFIAPALTTLLAITFIPFLFAIFISLHRLNLLEGGKFVFTGLGNYAAFFRDERAINAVFVTLQYGALAIAMQVALGVVVSLLIDRRFKFKALFRSLLIMPMFMPPVITGLIWRTFFDPLNGIINYYLGFIGLGNRIDWLGSTGTALLSIVIADSWQWTPFMILLFTATLDSVPEDLYEAAYVSGASERHIIQYVKLPLLVPTIFLAAVLRLIDVMKAFDLIYVMTKGGPGGSTETINMYAYIVGFNFFRIGNATAISYTFTLGVTVVLAFIVSKILRRQLGGGGAWSW